MSRWNEPLTDAQLYALIVLLAAAAVALVAGIHYLFHV